MNTLENRPWRVMLPWEQADEGCFDVDVIAPDAEKASLAAATKMLEADTGAEFDSEEDRDKWIRGRAEAALLVSDLRKDALQDLRNILAVELGLDTETDGAPEICWNALKALARLHRHHLLAKQPAECDRLAYRITRSDGDGAVTHAGSLHSIHAAVREARSHGGAYALSFL
ncbi:hypothetical protein RAS12_30355 (plasmid) [Achromobacter seleniivolatilans]|uniref:Uncharacterized protein n=1 Tax=Achromobacter seleniivolatilans TaxID=3047478 RepID=A0ABY9MBA9_9BURK|nr:hypothetical protein [Achromobacter sp. R39]WMD23937.1 hypothetical protein RAS12_30355 [Achromobacter sp. R39]